MARRGGPASRVMTSLPGALLAELDALCAALKIRRAVAIRAAIQRFVTEQRKAAA